ncbi:MAG TPA: metallophosphoesterase family protein [Thermomicrobiales bacterium]|nr:metallophosphoesterase family protein [Thermomicrobiales bacterium]
MTILIISDIHANLVALESVLAAAGDYDEIWNLGDIVGYGPRPRECVDRIRDLRPSASLIGNHDWAAIGRLALDEFNPVARYATYWTTAHLGAEHMTYLEELPNRVIEDEWMLVHGSPRHPVWEYVYTTRVARQNFEFFDSPVCFLGHTHIQLYISETMANRGDAPRQPSDGDVLDLSSDRFIVNPGSVGQPRDSNPNAAFALFNTETREVTFRRVAYDIAETQAQMEYAGLPRPLITRLALGV